MFVSNFSGSPTPIQIETVPQSAGSGIAEISAQDLHFAIESGANRQIFDLRHAADFAQSHVAGAVSVPAIMGAAPRLPELCRKNALIVLYSYAGAGPSTRSIAAALSRGGFAVQTLHGGWESWHASGLATDGWFINFGALEREENEPLHP